MRDHIKAHRPQFFSRGLDWRPASDDKPAHSTALQGWRYKKQDPNAFSVVDGKRSFSAWELRPVSDLVGAFDRLSDNVRRAAGQFRFFRTEILYRFVCCCSSDNCLTGCRGRGHNGIITPPALSGAEARNGNPGNISTHRRTRASTVATRRKLCRPAAHSVRWTG
jgi:hypothetical protein